MNEHENSDNLAMWDQQQQEEQQRWLEGRSDAEKIQESDPGAQEFLDKLEHDLYEFFGRTEWEQSINNRQTGEG